MKNIKLVLMAVFMFVLPLGIFGKELSPKKIVCEDKIDFIIYNQMIFLLPPLFEENGFIMECAFDNTGKDLTHCRLLVLYGKYTQDITKYSHYDRLNKNFLNQLYAKYQRLYVTLLNDVLVNKKCKIMQENFDNKIELTESYLKRIKSFVPKDFKDYSGKH